MLCTDKSTPPRGRDHPSVPPYRACADIGLPPIPASASNDRKRTRISSTRADSTNTTRSITTNSIMNAAHNNLLLSIGLDFVPGVGTIKGIIEAIIGRDIITGQERAWWERVLGIIPVTSAAAGAVAVSKIAEAAGDLARGVDKLGDVAETAKDIDRAADAVKAAEHAAEAATTGDLAHAQDDGHDHGHQTVPSDLTLRVKAFESLLVEKGLSLNALIDTYEHTVGPRNGARVPHENSALVERRGRGTNDTSVPSEPIGRVGRCQAGLVDPAGMRR